ncbi:hypothetical protein [Streptomyces sp. NPDC020965]|uniref:hypothetical protein n=1 Tax=Streptomyces sp. NPDC020965 TaxID=3365105 RepID=UPI003798DAD9
MSAHTTIPSRTEGRVDIRLPWWALALPVVAFAVLFVVMADPAQAQAVDGESDLRRALEYFQTLLTR